MKGEMVILAGPSAGAGKSTVLNMFLEKHEDWVRPPSVTTREPREGEIPGEDYIFVSREEFERMRENGEFLEDTDVTGELYGTPKQEIEALIERNEKVIMIKEVVGSLAIKKVYPETKLIALFPEHHGVLEARLRERGEEDELIHERLKLAEKETAQLKEEFDYHVTNPSGHPEKALEEIEKILDLS